VAACEANKEAGLLYEEAGRVLGQNVAQLHLPPIYYGGMVNEGGIEHWRAWCREALRPAKSSVTVHRTPVATPKPAESRAAAPAAPPPPKSKRKLIQEEPRDGMVQISIVRSGYEAPDGRSTVVGDVLALPPRIGEASR
jgi:hypothetical protein